MKGSLESNSEQRNPRNLTQSHLTSQNKIKKKNISILAIINSLYS